jgi:hypothetical protein
MSLANWLFSLHINIVALLYTYMSDCGNSFILAVKFKLIIRGYKTRTLRHGKITIISHMNMMNDNINIRNQHFGQNDSSVK